MIAGIVGSEAAKFTPETRAMALAVIESILIDPELTGYSSGHCHLGGIDIWTELVADRLNREWRAANRRTLLPYIYPPKTMNWSNGFKPRNIQIANISDVVHVITVKTLPFAYTGMRFDFCYHCMTNDHVKSGGCWTGHYAEQHGKRAIWHIIE